MGQDFELVAARVQKAEADYKTKAAMLRSSIRTYREKKQSLKSDLAAREILQELSSNVQKEVHQRLADVVTLCLKAVFDDPYEFIIQFEKKRGKTEACVLFKRGDLCAHPLEIAGGGAADVASFALRLASIMMRRPAVRRILVLDEPFRFVSVGLRPRVKQMITDLSEKMNVQIIMITHDPELVCGKVIDFADL